MCGLGLYSAEYGPVAGCCEPHRWTFGFCGRRRIFWPAEQLLASQEVFPRGVSNACWSVRNCRVCEWNVCTVVCGAARSNDVFLSRSEIVLIQAEWSDVGVLVQFIWRKQQLTHGRCCWSYAYCCDQTIKNVAWTYGHWKVYKLIVVPAFQF